MDWNIDQMDGALYPNGREEASVRTMLHLHGLAPAQIDDVIEGRAKFSTYLGTPVLDYGASDGER